MTEKLSHNTFGFRPSLSYLGGCLRHFNGITSSSDCPVICLLIVGLLHLHQPSRAGVNDAGEQYEKATHYGVLD